MPQPATHYLVMRKSIPEKFYTDWWDKYKQYFGLGSLAPDLFYFPMLEKFGLSNVQVRNDLSWENLANPLHSNGSYDMFCTLLEIAKSNKENENVGKKQLAFAIGYYSHVVTDCIFHPYIYRATEDYWFKTDCNAELKHKKHEVIIDDNIFKKHYSRDRICNINIVCNHDDSNGLLDLDIANQLNGALMKNYPGLYPNDSKIDQTNHPIHQAYVALVSSVDVLFSGEKIYLFGAKQIVALTVKEVISKFGSDFFTKKFFEDMENTDYKYLPPFSPEELCDFSIMESSDIFESALNFWNDENASNAKKYFSINKADFLGQSNFNLDTGLPAEYNNYSLMREGKSPHFQCKSKEIAEQMEYFASKLHNIKDDL